MWHRALLIGSALMIIGNMMPANELLSANTKPRRLVLCLDGTWNSPYDEARRDDGTKVLKPTNTLKLCRAVIPLDATGRAQVAYYDIGVGSLAEYPGISNRLLHFVDRLVGGAWGAGFEGNVEDALHFLTLNYETDDEIFIFGFSRGAATARAVTRFLDWAGGLPQKRDAYFLPVLFRAYVLARGNPSQRDVTMHNINEGLQQEGKAPLLPFHTPVVRYLGVWDTVMALGSRFKATGASTSSAARSFHAGTNPAACVKHARQALAVDEERFDFRPEIWRDHGPDQVMEQRWFAGVHSNVGGGYTHDGLANIAFDWILDGAHDEGLATDPEYTKYFKKYPLASLYSSNSTLYRVLDVLRFRVGQGKRVLIERPATANLTLDGSVIKRMRAKPDELQKGSAPTNTAYRPENVLSFLACQPDLSAYLESIGIDDLATKPLPDDVLQRIAALQPRCKSPQ
jgi:uncharacterized protein (DUF2235 family)